MQEAFASTHWSLVVAARERSTDQGSAAMTALCRLYWPPLYAYIRRAGHRPEDAQDLTQSFFTYLLEKNIIRFAVPDRGRLRSFLLISLKNFMANEWRREHAEKRGGQVSIISLDDSPGAESLYTAEAGGGWSPEILFQRVWALGVLERATNRIAAEFALQGKSDLFDHLKIFLTGDGSGSTYADLAQAAGMTNGAARVAVHRLRARFRTLIREEVAQTLEKPGDASAVEEELRELISVL
jgi:DNA-directed RNA polymerase specialized sigma24 family protein